MEDSFYSQFDGFEAPTVAKTATVETPHQNRADLSKPYSGTFAQKVKEDTTDSAPKTSAAYEWALLIANRTSSNHIAVKVNGSFVRNKIDGENYKSERKRYFNLYNKELNDE